MFYIVFYFILFSYLLWAYHLEVITLGVHRSKPDNIPPKSAGEQISSYCSVVEHCVSSAKVVGSIPREHMY